ncbi:hypothetical protein F4680DRAFT_150777 [Xylaria scruposa]|nr:hypothetical protein F4680DRAFT_150777 [Xylaria scruposa]
MTLFYSLLILHASSDEAPGHAFRIDSIFPTSTDTQYTQKAIIRRRSVSRSVEPQNFIKHVVKLTQIRRVIQTWVYTLMSGNSLMLAVCCASAIPLKVCAGQPQPSIIANRYTFASMSLHFIKLFSNLQTANFRDDLFLNCPCSSKVVLLVYF